MTRDGILDKARDITTKDRDKQYGSPEDCFGAIAAMWTAYKGVAFSPADVAAMMILLKVARIANDPSKEDSWVDAAGYAACGGEVSFKSSTRHGNQI